MDVQHGQLGFTNGFVIAEIVLSLSRTLNRGQLNPDHYKFWLPTSQLLVLDMCLSDAFS
ncbi:DUF645 family protein [Vibrio cholerae]|nr:DUF645 family protein [Vibrio cholerae]